MSEYAISIRLVPPTENESEHVELSGLGNPHDFLGEEPSHTEIAIIAERQYPGPGAHVAEHAIRLAFDTREFYRLLEDEGAKWLLSEKSSDEPMNEDERKVLKAVEEHSDYAYKFGPLSLEEIERIDRIKENHDE